MILQDVSALCQALPDKEIASRLHAYLKPFGQTGNLIGTVLVARGGRILFRQSYGMANYELRVSNSNGTRYHIASVSKPFTAAAILQLQEQGRLRVSDHVSRYVTDFPNGDRITLDNLLTHTSGIPDINGLEDYDTFARRVLTPSSNSSLSLPVCPWSSIPAPISATVFQLQPTGTYFGKNPRRELRKLSAPPHL